jgi:hypothetical protein
MCDRCLMPLKKLKNNLSKLEKLSTISTINCHYFYKKFLAVRTGEPFFKKVPGRRRQKLKKAGNI